MTKLSSTLKKKSPIIPTAIEGLFVRDLPVKQMQSRFSTVETDLKEDPEGTIVKMFQELICDADGNVFEDVDNYEQIAEAFSVRQITTVLEQLTIALNPQSSKN